MTVELADKRKTLQEFLENILDSYRLRIDNVAPFMKQVLVLLVGFHQEQDKMIEELKLLLSRTRSLRKKDFELIVKDLRQKQNHKEKDMERVLLSFLKQEEEMVEYLKTILKQKNFKADCFQKIKQEILEKQAQREREVGMALRNFHLEVQEINQGLKKLLERGENIKIRDLKEFVGSIYIQQEEREARWGKTWDEFWVIREKINCQWQKVALEK